MILALACAVSLSDQVRTRAAAEGRCPGPLRRSLWCQLWHDDTSTGWVQEKVTREMFCDKEDE